MDRSCVVWMVAAGLVACAAEDRAEPLGRASSAIVGGTEDSGDPAVVAIYVGPAQACSGSIVSKNTVLTAGHCAVDETLLAFPGVSIVFGRDADDLDAREIYVKSWKVHPKFAGEGKPYDVALFTLEEDVNDVTPLPLADVALPDGAVGTMVRHVGYGENDEKEESGDGIKRTATYPIDKIDPLLLWSGGAAAQTCEGDSGGPALITSASGVEAIHAVVSDGPNCHESGNDARVDVKEVHDWIVQTAGLTSAPVAAATTTTTTAGANGAPPEATETDAPAPAADPAAPAPAPTPTAEPPAASGCNAGGRASGAGSSFFVLALLALRSAVRRRGRGARGAARARPCSARPS